MTVEIWVRNQKKEKILVDRAQKPKADKTEEDSTGEQQEQIQDPGSGIADPKRKLRGPRPSEWGLCRRKSNVPQIAASTNRSVGCSKPEKSSATHLTRFAS